MDMYTVTAFVSVIREFIQAYRERTQQQRESTDALVQMQREQFQKLSQ